MARLNRETRRHLFRFIIRQVGDIGNLRLLLRHVGPGDEKLFRIQGEGLPPHMLRVAAGGRFADELADGQILEVDATPAAAGDVQDRLGEQVQDVVEVLLAVGGDAVGRLGESGKSLHG